jgi:hypothetical protein
MSRAVVLVVALSDLGRDPRVDRQIEALRVEFDVIAAGFGAPRHDDIAFIRLASLAEVTAEQDRENRASPPPLRTRARRALLRRAMTARTLAGNVGRPSGRPVRLYDAELDVSPRWRVWERQLADVPFDVLLINDVTFLPLAARMAGPRALVFDAHELWSEQDSGVRRWRWLRRPYIRYVEARWLPRVDAMTTVCQPIADRYEQQVGVNSTVVTNATALQELAPSPVSEPLRLVHWGGASVQRRLELMIDAVRQVRRPVTFDLVLVGNPAYIARLREVAADDARVRFLDPVAMPELPRFGNDYDVGLFLVPPLSPNMEFVLPNKFFEFLQARLAVMIGPSPEMARVVREFDVGVVSEGFSAEAFARVIVGLDRPVVERYKRNADAAARALNAEANAEVIREVVRGALASSRRRPGYVPSRSRSDPITS